MEDLVLKDVGEYELSKDDRRWVSERHRALDERDEQLRKLLHIDQALERISDRLEQLIAAKRRR
jgi:hypothetical protein